MKQMLSSYTYAIFDCDGVILDSNKIKTNGFRHALRNYPDKVVNQFIEYHQKNGGVSRYKKFDYFFQDLLCQKNENTYEAVLESFQEYCLTELNNSVLIPGIKSFLEKLCSHNIPMYIVSGGDKNEIKHALAQKGVLKYFDKIFGNSTSKAQHLENLFADSIVKGDGIYFGDALIDYESAFKYSIDFIYVSGASEWVDGSVFCRDRGVAEIESFQNFNLIKLD